MFEQARQWLSASGDHVFPFVVDELHTYRRTPGTEVAYLIRVLLDRIGLSPDSAQLRIIASSASLANDVSGLGYLEAFFGRDRNRFRVVGGASQPLSADAFRLVRSVAPALKKLRDDLSASTTVSLSTAADFHR